MANIKKRARRGVKLDPRKIRELAFRKGWKNFGLFESAYHTYKNLPNDVNTPTAPVKAWNGTYLDKGYATDIALLLGESSYASLLYDSPPDISYPEKLNWDASYSPPGALLKAEYGIVPFHHRRAELDDLDSWCDSDERLGVRLYTGPGGMGKTRLAIEQCQRLVNRSKNQWEGGFLFQSGTQEPKFDWLTLEERSIFVVIDYAETRRKEVVAFLQASLRSKTKIRVLLLARAAAEWWNILKTETQGVGDLLMSPATNWILLQPLLLDAKTRKDSWLLAAKTFATCLKKKTIDKLPKGINIENDSFERVLLLHMQALLCVEQQQVNANFRDILEVVLNRERNFWEKQLERRKLPRMFHQAISTAMARISLVGGIKRQDVTRVLADIPVLNDSTTHERQAIIELLQEIYPSTDNENMDKSDKNNFIEPLQPDLLGEHLIQAELRYNENIVLSFLFAEE